MEETQLHSSFVSIAFGMLNTGNEINFSTAPNRPHGKSNDTAIRVRGSTTFNWKPIPFPYSCKAVKYNGTWLEGRDGPRDKIARPSWTNANGKDVDSYIHLSNQH
ncbi:uncharacterized protein EAF02_007880 [Botrytis sinoallii]|uniref:uncharacterized protein n=1 Tax=Botrytis sinoallii TaxID=1463999 RepID=UPI0019001FB6|nr:uncharacterized protein EAF02_007880 [Botrytis sinoallii]KAF7879710.1 hypothetical protein EAF02_007880 [Botrytis sinoallii]